MRFAVPTALILASLGLGSSAFAGDVVAVSMPSSTPPAQTAPATPSQIDANDWLAALRPENLQAPTRVETLFSDAKGNPIPPLGIVNGQDAGAGEYPQVVYLEMSSGAGKEGSCSGSLINPEWVLTAAHCVEPAMTDGNASEEDSNGITVRFDTQNVHTSPGTGVASDHLIHHPDWVSAITAEQTGDFKGDVGLVHLSTPQPGRPFMPLNARKLDSGTIGFPITFIGFGITEVGNSDSGTKRFATSRISSLPDSRPYLLNAFDPKDRHSTCSGDSGGPGVITQGTGYVQASITSYGGSTTCGGVPSGHMRVDHYLDWIKSKVGNVSVVEAAIPGFQCSNRLNPKDPNSVALGIAGFDLRCSVDFNPPEGERLTKVTWNWSDGSEPTVVDSGDLKKVSHTYTEAGRFTVAMKADYEIDTEGGAPLEQTQTVTKYGFVRVCAVPDVAFEVTKDVGLTYAFRNRTNIAKVYGCVYNAQWDIYEGDTTSGEPLYSLKTWEPTITFDAPGTYTAILNVGGIGGTAAARASLQVTRAKGANGGCDVGSTGGAGLLGLAFAGGALLSRRRRNA